ncbi:MAG: putative bifunctional diguanylate cyclase/phosphodiesterase [Acidimicrobiales bacterium]
MSDTADAVGGADPSGERPIGWWKAVVERSSDVLVALDRGGVIRYLSPSGARIFGWLEEDIVGTIGFQHVHPDDVDRIQMVLQRGLSGAPTGPYPTFRLRHASGAWCHVEARATNLLDDEHISAFIVSFRDVTDRIEAEQAVAERDERYRQIVEASPEAILIHQDGVVVHANPAALRMLGAEDRQSVLGLEPTSLLEIDPEESTKLSGRSAVHSLPVTTADRRLYRLDGSVLDVELTSIPTVWDGFAAVQVIARDVTERRQADMTLLHLATHDPLTGLPNRSLLDDRLHHASARAQRTHRPFAVLFLDLDRFKIVNDSHGHEVGDKMLRQVAARLVDAVRPGDTVARLGGDEFVIVVEDLLVTDTVDLVVERVQTAFGESFVVDGREFNVGASIGVLVTAEGGDPRALLRDADAAMYTAKTQGRSKAVRFDIDLREQVSRHEELELRLRAAIDEHQMTGVLQPIVQISSRQVVGVEVLMRWRHPDRGILLPEAFMEVADDAGLLPQMSAQMLDELLAEIAPWWSEHQRSGQPPLMLGLNLSARELMSTGYTHRLPTLLRDRGISPTRVCIELSEDTLLDDPIGVIDALSPLREVGAMLAIDDFGSGYTSLAALRRFGPDYLKIDRSIVAGMVDAPSDAATVRAIIQMGHALGIGVIAEGVELVEQQHLLTVLGCDLAQGYLFGRPLPCGDLDTLGDAG